MELSEAEIKLLEVIRATTSILTKAVYKIEKLSPHDEDLKLFKEAIQTNLDNLSELRE